MKSKVVKYTPLHNHDEFSALDGFSHPHEYLDRIVELGYDSFSITNHGNQMSWIYYAKLIKDNDKYKHIKINYGVEFYEANDMFIQDSDNKYTHLVMLARNENGRKAINELVTRSIDGFYYKPRIDLKLVKSLNCGDDVVVLSACLASKIAREHDYNKCIEYIKEYKGIFPHFYLEMQSHSHIDQEVYNNKILQLSKDTNTPYVVTTDSHASTKDELYYQGRHVQIAQDNETMTESYEGCYVQSVEDIHEIMDKQVGHDVVELGLHNTNVINDLIEQVYMPFQEPQLPSYPLPQGFNSDVEYLKHLVNVGWNKRNIDSMSSEDVRTRKERIDYELSVITQMKFDGYFIIVWDFINWAKNNGVMVGVGRGSGAGSYVCYMLGITDIDPIRYNLIFERFLNPERISMPDLDIDFSDREPVVKYLAQKYGKDNVCQIANFSYISPLNSIRDSFRVYGHPHQMAEKISKLFSHATFEECIANNPTLYNDYPEYYDAFELASKISGRVRGVGIHAGGVGIVDTTMSDYMGMMRGGKGERVIQVDKRNVESIGIIKFDLLGVSTLKLVQDVVNETGIDEWEVNVNNDTFISDNDTYSLLQSANTNAVFQVESTGMKDLLLRLEPHDIEEVSAVLALYRPDTMSMLEDYIECKHGRKEMEYIHDDMKPILGNTFSQMIYQEQMLSIVRQFGGRSYGGADLFRKGVGSKNTDLIKQEANKLYQEILDNGYDEEIAHIISDEMSTKGGYSFNKSHSFSYAVLCLQTAYLKSHYPVHFYKALFNLRKADAGKLNKYIIDALDNNVKVLPPNINKSELDFTVSDNKVLFGLSSISGLGESALLPILEERKTNGKFKSLDDFIKRTNVTESQLISLIKSGAIPCKDKSQLMLKYANEYLLVEKYYKPVSSLPTLSKLKELGIDTDIVKDKEHRLKLYNNFRKQDHVKKQIERNDKIIESFKIKHMQDSEMWEFETLSIFLTNNPFDEVVEYIESYDDAKDNSEVVMIGVISQVVNKKNKRKQQYAFINVCTAYGLVQVACWAGQYSKYQDYIKRGTRVALLCNKQDENYSIKELKTYKQWLIDRNIK